MPTFILHVNGTPHEITADSRTPLIHILRQDLGLMSPKFACGLEQCGACKVLMDGEAVPSCRRPASDFVGTSIITLEGLGNPSRFHPVQQAFVDEQAAQCGYCTAGMIVAATALLAQNPAPTDGEIREGLQRHLCRCGTYHRILRAVKRASQAVTP